MSPEQRRVYETVVNGPRGRVIGPLRAAIHNPELAERWSSIGELLRYKTSIPGRYSELAIIITARRWTSQLEWTIHAGIAAREGLPASVIDDIRVGRPPVFTDDGDAIVYEYARQLQQSGVVDADAYEAARARFGVTGIVELTAIIGYYTMVAMTLNAHELTLPDSAPELAPLTQSGLPLLPAANGR
jgi:4-carboxymuconolactone decarboxylase